jgi:hypothetical protein
MSKIFNNADIYIQGGTNGVPDAAGVYWNDTNQASIYIDASDNLIMKNNNVMALSATNAINIGYAPVTFANNTSVVNISGTTNIGMIAPLTYLDGGTINFNQGTANFSGTVYVNGFTFIGNYADYPQYTGQTQYAYYASGGNSGTVNNPPAPNANVSLLTAYRIACGGEIDCVSDVRIKDNILEISSIDALDKIRLLQPKTFYYIDKQKGYKINYGFIAQEVEEVFDDAITVKKDYIPNIFKHAKMIDKNTITFHHFVTKNITGDNLSDIKIKVYLPSNKEFIVTIKEVIDEKTIRINEEIEDEYVFVYGQEVNDFHLVEKNAIFTLTTSAVKQLDKELQETKQIVRNQQDEINALKEEMRQLKELLLKR